MPVTLIHKQPDFEDRFAQRLARGEQMLLADKLFECGRAHSFGERPGRCWPSRRRSRAKKIHENYANTASWHGDSRSKTTFVRRASMLC